MTANCPPGSCRARVFRRASIVPVACWLAVLWTSSGCGGGPLNEGPVGQGDGEGPGHRQQVLGMSPEQELQLGRQAYEQILNDPAEFGRVLPADSPPAQRVRAVTKRIIAATRIEPLEREMNLHPGQFEWEVNVLDSPKVNAFCLPGGKIAVFGGLLRVTENDDQLAAVISHEVAHALAHHVSERTAQTPRGGALGMLRGKAFDREQEAEADHIGIFLMTFAGYNPEEAVRLWDRMQQMSAGQVHIPEILSDHPNDAHRQRKIAEWVPRALAAKQAFKEGRIEPVHH